MPEINADESANLVIMDQFGVKDVTPEIVSDLSDCKRTDILFFIPASFIHRFQQEDSFKRVFNFNTLNSDHYTITRYICQHFRGQVKNKDFHLAPFSIKSKRGNNIYGVIFGSGHLLGLEKFLTVCWSIDSKTGQANYAMDRDSGFYGQMSILEEDNVFTKIEKFKEDLKELISERNPDNLEMYEFVLTNGFTPKKAREILIEMQDEMFFRTTTLQGEKIRKHAFYLSSKPDKTIRFVRNH